jgi:hypothetical protein
VAKKSRKDIDRKINVAAYFHYERLRRNPYYRADYEKFISLHHDFTYHERSTCDNKLSGKALLNHENQSSRCQEKIRELCDKYGLSFLPNPYTPRHIELLTMLNLSAVPKVSHAILGSGLSRGSIKTFLIDINRDLAVIKKDITYWVLKERTAKSANDSNKYDHIPHLSIIERRFAVYDLRDKKPPMKYTSIFGHMQKKGFYKDKGLDGGIALVKKDYAKAFYYVYGVSYKEYDKTLLKKSDFKGCSSCKKRKTCKELCPEAEYSVSLVEVKRKEKILDEIRGDM